MKQSLRFNIMLLATLLMCAFLSTLLIGEHLFLKEIQDRDFQKSSRWQIKILAQSVSQAMWDMNDEAVLYTVRNIVRRQEIQKIKISDAEGKLIAEEINEQYLDKVLPLPSLVVTEPIEYVSHTGDKKNVGEVSIEFSRLDRDSFRAKFTRTIIFNSILVMLIYLTCFYYLSGQIFKPVQAITRSMLRLAKGEKSVLIPYQEKNDEIGAMSRALQTFKDHAVNSQLLEEEIKERIRIQEELQEAMLKADSASRAKSTFLAKMSHEIRTPLNGVLATAELLEQTTLNKKQNLYVSIIKKSGELLLGILNDILDLSKIEAHKLELNLTPFNLIKSLGVPIDIFRSAAKQKNIDLQFKIDKSVPAWVIGDKHRLKQVMTNLVGNAVKYTKEGFIRVFVSAREQEDAIILRVEVSDSGIGIAQEAIGEIFETFIQAHKAEAINGTGLGLSICKSLVLLMNGDIGVESVVGEGSTFWFEVPLRETPAIEEIDESSEPFAEDHGEWQVLLAEDYEINRIIISDMLETLGAKVDLAFNGEEALTRCTQKKYDLIFMDCDMPVLNGIEATRRLRELYGPDLPIVAISAHAFVREVQDCYDVGMNDFVNKPVKMTRLSEVLKKWAGKNASEIAELARRAEPALPKPRAEIEKSVAKEWFKKDREKGLKFVRLTLKDSDSLKDDLLGAAESGDFDRLASAAHALKSVSAQAGGMALSLICQEIEQAGRNHDQTALAELIPPFHAKYADLGAYLNTLVAD